MKYLRWRGARYVVPAAVVVAIAAGGLVPTISGASSPPKLPAKSAQQLLAEVAVAKVPPLSGAVTWAANLGLNDLSSLAQGVGQGDSSSGFDPITLLSGNWQMNVWLDGAKGERVALLEPSAQELDLVRNGTQAWYWDSSTQSVLHVVAKRPASQPRNNSTGPTMGNAPVTPDQFASNLLSHLSPSTSVTTGTPVYVAGEPAYQLVIAPKGASGSTIDEIQVDVGAVAPLLGVPLRVSVYATDECTQGQSCSPALQLGYTGQIHLGTPPPSEMTFTPPHGAKVVTRTIGGGTSSGAEGIAGWFAHFPLTGRQGSTKAPDLQGAPGGLSTSGSGWATVISGPAGGLFANAEALPLSALTTVVSVKGQPARLFSTALLNVLLTSNGRFYVGFVAASVLEAAASAST